MGRSFFGPWHRDGGGCFDGSGFTVLGLEPARGRVDLRSILVDLCGYLPNQAQAISRPSPSVFAAGAGGWFTPRRCGLFGLGCRLGR